MIATKLRGAQQLIRECLESIEGPDEAKQETPPKLLSGSSLSASSPDFTVPLRPFMKTYAELSGAKKFTLLVAWLAKGDLASEVALASVASQWNTMSGMLKAKFNRKFSADAREADWVATVKDGVYVLRPGWTQILNDLR
jgi:hypothetical protein